MAEKERYEWFNQFDNRVVDNNELAIIDVVKRLNQQDKEIEELKEKYNKLYECYKKTASEDLKDKYDLAEKNEELKTQPAEIVEKIRNLAEKDFDFDTCTYCGEDVHNDVVLTKNDFNETLDKVLKEYKKIFKKHGLKVGADNSKVVESIYKESEF
jgi:FtsZ-binding cell division protein ZapB